MKTPEQIADEVLGSLGYSVHDPSRGIAAVAIHKTIEADRAQRNEPLAEWSRVYEMMYDADTFHASLNFSEALALADLLIADDRDDLAHNLMQQWAEHDPEMAKAYARELSEWFLHNHRVTTDDLTEMAWAEG